MVRYYPPSKVIEDLNTAGNQFTLENGQAYYGKYYLTYDGKAFSGPSPRVGPNERLYAIPDYPIFRGSEILNLGQNQIANFINKTNLVSNRIPGKPNSYYPQPLESDYRRGYVIRYFTKKENEKGFVTEISQEEYNSIINGTADYDISIYQTAKILWKLTGPLRSQRKSQYNVIPGIVETNQRLTEETNKTFIGILEFIGGEYTKFARPTA
jgi:hypothetical protein